MFAENVKYLDVTTDPTLKKLSIIKFKRAFVMLV